MESKTVPAAPALPMPAALPPDGGTAAGAAG